MKSRASKGNKLLFIVLSAFIACVLIGLCVFFGIYFSAKLNKEAVVAERAQIKILDGNNEEIEAVSLNRYVEYENINTDLINAFVALEDKRFFKHKGVDYYRTAGALIHNIKAGYFKEGGSTITQQLAKNTQLSSEKTFVRKIKEMKLAKDIEKNYSKEEILEMYLNAIYYGNGVYGIDSACKTYFDKSPSELNIPECALLAGIVKSPSAYSPINNPDKAINRMQLVLKLMLNQGYLTAEEYENAMEYRYISPQTNKYFPYLGAVISEACEKLKLTETELIKSPYTIYTYYDKTAQSAINKAYLSKEFEINTKNGEEAYSSVMVGDNENGGIIAFYSNKKYNVGQFRRQPGSTIKPIAVYAPALNNYSITAADCVYDQKTDFGGYTPSNYKDNYIGRTDIETALKNSINTIAVDVYSKTDRNYCLNTVKKMGISVDKNDGDLAFALGGMTYGVTGAELTEAYMTLANGGRHRKCGFIKEIRQGNAVIYRKDSATDIVLNEDSAYILTDMLVKTAKDGTAKKLASIPYAVAAKTGTVSGAGGENSDAWCVSFTTANTVCAWFGGQDYSDEHTITTTGGGLPTMLTKYVYQCLKAPKIKEFEQPESVVDAEIDIYARDLEGKLYLTHFNTPEQYRQGYCFSVKNCPSQFSPYFTLERPDFFASIENGIIKLYFDKKYPYSYKIYREKISDNRREEVYSYNTDISDALFPKNGWIDGSAVKGDAYIYSIEIYLNNNLVGASRTEAVLR